MFKGEYEGRMSVNKLVRFCGLLYWVLYPGSTQDHQTLKELKVVKNSKFMVIGSTMNDLLKVTAPDLKEKAKDDSSGKASSSKEPLCKQTVGCIVL